MPKKRTQATLGSTAYPKSPRQRSAWRLRLLILVCCSTVLWGQSGFDPAIDGNIKTLIDKGQRVEDRQAAARFLGHLSPPPKSAVQALSGVLRDRSDPQQVRTAAVEALATIGEDPSEAESVVTVIGKTLADGPSSQNVTIRAAVARALGRILHKTQAAQNTQTSHEAVLILKQVLTRSKEDPIVRSNAAWALGQLGNAVEKNEMENTVEALITAVRMTPANVSQTAANSLLKMHQPAASKLKGELSDSDPSFRWNVAWILGEIGTDAKEAVPSLTTVLSNSLEDPNVRGAAAWAIGKVGREAKGTRDFLGTVGARSREFLEMQFMMKMPMFGAMLLGPLVKSTQIPS